MERDQILKVMVPVGGFAVLLLIVGGVIALNSGGASPTTSAQAAAPQDNLPPSEPPQPPPNMDFPLDDPKWKDIGDGMKIWDVKEGSGEVCPTLSEKPNLIPIMHYTGWFTNGVMFDSSRTKGRPLDLALNDLIVGWKRGVPGMKVGGVRRLIVPSDLGYGARGKGNIPGGATLVFEMELLRIF